MQEETKGFWLCPSRRRPEKLKNLFASLVNTHTSTPGRILIDEADWIANCQEYLKLVLPDKWEFSITQGETMGAKYRETMPFMMDRDWIGMIVDDQIAITDQWDIKILQSYNGKNIVSGNDGDHAPSRMCSPVIFSMSIIKALGYFFPTNLNHLFVDDVWENLGKASGCWTVRMDIFFKHDHPINDQSKQDDTHHKTYNQENWNKARTIYIDWLQNDFLNDVKKIKRLISRVD